MTKAMKLIVLFSTVAILSCVLGYLTKAAETSIPAVSLWLQEDTEYSIALQDSAKNPLAGGTLTATLEGDDWGNYIETFELRYDDAANPYIYIKVGSANGIDVRYKTSYMLQYTAPDGSYTAQRCTLRVDYTVDYGDEHLHAPHHFDTAQPNDL